MKTEIRRLTTLEEVIYYKNDIVSNLVEVSPYLSLYTDGEFWFKTICRAVGTPKACIVASFDEAGQLIGIGLAQEVTPLYYPQKLALVLALKVVEGRKDVIRAMQKEFERWCKEHHIKHYFILSTRQSGAAMRCFGEFGLKKKLGIFTKGVY